jgi:flagellar motility protein MotE (MotC chaperone)
MISFARNMRLLPVVLIAIVCLFALKVLGLVLEGGYTLVGAPSIKEAPIETTGSVDAITRPRIQVPAKVDAELTTTPRSEAPSPWAQRMYNFPDGSNAGTSASIPLGPGSNPNPNNGTALAQSRAPDDITGSAGPKPADKPAEAKADKPAAKVPEPKPDGTPVSLDAGRLASAAERALLERLQERRQELEARAREIEIRENLLKVAEKRLEARAGELKEVEGRVQANNGKKDEGEAERYKGLVTMYENMKAKDAAKIFDRLEMRVLLEVVSQINPRRMSDILGLMTPEAAEKLTVELANRGKGERTAAPSALPKIEGRQNGS